MRRFNISIPIYPILIQGCFSENSEELGKEMLKIEKAKEVELSTIFTERNGGMVFPIGNIIYLFLSTRDVSIIAHEVFHIVYCIHSVLGIPFIKNEVESGGGTEEFGAYMMDYILEKVINKIGKF